jgi:hypothetical protein
MFHNYILQISRPKYDGDEDEGKCNTNGCKETYA